MEGNVRFQRVTPLLAASRHPQRVSVHSICSWIQVRHEWAFIYAAGNPLHETAWIRLEKYFTFTVD